MVLTIALVLGGAVSWYSVQQNHGFGSINIGQWTAWPLAGSLDADPYTKAKVAAEGEVPLGAAEGIAFFTRLDDQGNALQRNCQYQLTGQTPLARFWTLTAQSDSDEATRNQSSGSAKHLISRDLIRNSTGEFTLQVGPQLTARNWLQVEGEGQYALILRLYDSPITSTTGIVDPVMPTVQRLRCLT